MISLRNVHLLGQGPGTINIQDRKIKSIVPAGDRGGESAGAQLDFENCLAFPGLINSHDHLHFNLFPRLGNRIYSDYVEWGADIHAMNRKEIDATLKIPKPLRAQWGVYKNLLNGVTTAVHHGEYLPLADPVIEVFQRCTMLHSVRLEKNWRWKLNRPFARPWPFVIHAGEGTNPESRREIDSVVRWNFFKRKLIAIHGVGMNGEQAGAFAALVWCPESNFFLLNQTADIPRLRQKTTVLFGTDSTLTANWSVWEQLRFARNLRMLSDEDLFRSITLAPALVWEMPEKGMLKEGCQADVVVAQSKAPAWNYAAWFDVNPADIVLVVQNGRIRLCDEARYRQIEKAGWLEKLGLACFSKVRLADSIRYVQGDLPGLIAEIKTHAPEARFPIQTANF